MADAAPTDGHAMLLISGASGTGKSTVARTVASVLGVHHVVSTDVVRGVLRSVITDAVSPELHADSFAVPLSIDTEGHAARAGHVNIAGFLEQARVVRTGVDAAIRQMRREDTGIVVEGVHLLPDVPTTIPDVGPVPVVMLAVLDEARHREHFLSRDREVAGRRPPGRYFRNFERIRAVQAHLVERANAAGVRVVDTSDRTVQETTREVLAAIGRG